MKQIPLTFFCFFFGVFTSKVSLAELISLDFTIDSVEHRILKGNVFEPIESTRFS